MIACTADGAGSAKRSDLGSAITCEVIADSAARHFETHGDFSQLQLDHVISWCDAVREKLRHTADSKNCKMRDLASTLCTAILSPESSIFFQIGDGAITVGNEGVYGVVFWPQSGEYANVTNFMTSDNYQDKLEFQATTSKFNELAMFTDGIERIALDFEGQTPHVPFFQPLFRAVRGADQGANLERDLAQFLQSESVKKRSDDDKTLILATNLESSSAGANHAAD